MRALLLLMLLSGPGAPLPAGSPPPPIDAPGSDGRPFGEDFGGRVTIVDFFATWCPHCRRALADYDRLLDAFGDRVRLVIVDVEEDPATVRAYFARHKLPDGAELVIDRSGAASRAWRVTGIPTSYVIDREGIVRDSWSGWSDDSYAYLAQLIPALEAEAARGPRAAHGRKGKRAADRGADRPKARPLSPEEERARRLGVEILR